MFRRVGEGTDVVSKEMYDFEDKGGRHIALRPEGTASIARAFVQHHPATPWKVWYAAPSFRYEQPAEPAATASTTSSASRRSARPTPTSTSRSSPWRGTTCAPSGLRQVRLLVNSMGTRGDRAAYVELLRDWLAERLDQLDPADHDKVGRPPHAGPRLQAARPPRPWRPTRRTSPHHLSPEGDAHFDRVRAGLKAARHPVHHRAPPGAGARLLHAHHLRVRVRRARGGAEHRAGRWPLRRPRRGAGRPAHAGHRLRVGRRAGAAGVRRRGRVPHARPQRRRVRRRHQRGRRGAATSPPSCAVPASGSTAPTTSAPCGRR